MNAAIETLAQGLALEMASVRFKPLADADPSAAVWTITLPPKYADDAANVVPERLAKEGSHLADL